MNQIKAGILLNYATICLTMLLGLLYTPYMLRMMGQSEYGLYSLVASVIAYLTIMDFGFGNAIVRYTAKFRAENKVEEQSRMFGMFLILYSAIGLLAAVAGALLYVNIDALFGDTMTDSELHKARIMMIIMIFNLAITFPFSLFGSIVTAHERFVFMKSLGIIRTLLNTVVMVALLAVGYKAIAMVVVHTVFNVATLLAQYLYCKYKLQVKIRFGRFQWGFLKEVSIYSFWIFLCIIIEKVYWNTGQFVLGAVSGTVAVAVFAVAIQLVHMYMNFSMAMSGVFLPKISGMVAQHAPDQEISNLFIKTGRLQCLIVGMICSGFIVFGRQFITLWAGEGYENAYWICLLCFAALAIPLVQTLGPIVLQARNEMKFRSLLYAGFALLCVLLQVVLAKAYGGVGCALAILLVFLLGQGLILNIYYYKQQRLDIPRFWKEILKMLIVPTLLTIVGLYLIHRCTLDTIISLFAGIMAYGVVYVVAIYWMSMNAYERELFGSIVRKVFRK
ncbi:MAG: oligosaccharide flippase family protein [Alistipes sp.]|nr:oligosaccharide flippase family protein [Alistipes sp.]